MVYLRGFRRNSILKCVLQPKITKKSINPLFGHPRCQSTARVLLLVVINLIVNLTLSRTVSIDTATCWPNTVKFFLHVSHFEPSLGVAVAPFAMMGKLYGSLREPKMKIW